MTHKFQTTAIWTDADGEDHDVEVTVTYTYHKGYAGDRTDPPEHASVEIDTVTPDVPADVWDTLVEECFEHYAAMADDAADYRYEMGRDT
jgi:hypothetical protein